MAYFICHCLRAYSLSLIDAEWVYAYHMDWKYMVRYHVMNYRGLGLDDFNGNQGGAFNAHWEKCQSSLGLASTLGFGHSQLGYLYSAPPHYEEI